VPTVPGGFGVGEGGNRPLPTLSAQQDFLEMHAATATSACVEAVTHVGGGYAALVVATKDVRCTTIIAAAMGCGMSVA